MLRARVALAPLALAAPPLRLALTTPHAPRGDVGARVKDGVPP